MYRNVVLVALLLFAACSSSSGQPSWLQVKNRLVGKTYTDVVACAGIPDSQAAVSEGTGAVLYRMSTATGGSFCDATLLVKEGRVVSVTEREFDVPLDWNAGLELCSKRFESCPWAAR